MKRYAKIVLVFIVTFHTVAFFSACSRQQPKAYVSVEKPPVKVTYIDFHKDITPETVDMMIRHAMRFKYEEMIMNDKNEIIIDYNADAHGSSITETTIGVR